jgi:glycosyltransferase involved in cell wall biosynthesis
VKISIVVPAYNEEKLLGASLEQIKQATAAFHELTWETELVVCDNNSTDRTGDVARAAGAKVVFEPVNQIARSRNCGAAAAVGDWFVFVDADSHPSGGLFREVGREIASGECLAGGCTVALDEPVLIGRMLVGLWNLISRTRLWAAGSFIFCEAAAFREVGGFSHELFASEELDLSVKLKRLARKRGKRFVILHRYPIVTSARKMHLYSRREHVRFLTRAVLRPRHTVRNREACPTWYDGRR